LNGTLIGLRLNSGGSIGNPRITAKIFLENKPSNKQLEIIRKALVHSLGADDNLREFYSLAEKDPILKYVVADLRGMHSTSLGDTVFPDSILAILLQMAPLKRSNEMMNCVIRKYGEKAEFDDKTVYTWPLPESLANLNLETFAKTCKIGYRAKTNSQTLRKDSEKRFPKVGGVGKTKPRRSKKEAP